MEKRRKIGLWFITALLFPFIFCSITSCSDDDNDNNKKNYKYLYASNERENTSLADREKYAPYGWRLECLTDETMPKNYRTCLDDFKERDVIPGYDPDYMPSIKGLKELKASASANFSSSGFDGLLSALRKLHQGPITIVDLRSETHGFFNGMQLSHYGLQNWANIGLSLEETMEKEHGEIHDAMGKVIIGATIDSDNNYVPIDPIDINVSTAQTEGEACALRGVGYIRFNSLDHAFPSDRNIERFISFIQSLPDNIWLHFHCKAGKGRTSTYLTIFDMLRNPDLSLRDAAYRQYKLGGEFVLDDGSKPNEKEWKIPLKQERVEMLQLLEQYIKENRKNNYAVKWSEWKKK